MSFILVKIFVTAIIIVMVSEIAKVNDRVGGLIAAMPLTTFLILFWMYYENASENKISAHVSYTFLYLIYKIKKYENIKLHSRVRMLIIIIRYISYR